ncbi:MAG: macro domain-containing protein [bacterium]
MQIQINNKALELAEGDITDLSTDAIVNAANSALLLGGGVAGAIRFKGGPSIQQECSNIGHCPVGGAVITGAGNLPARHVIHAVGPRMGEGDEDAKLRNATLSSLTVADDNQLRSIAFPAISTGIFGFPIERCAEIMLMAAIEYLRRETRLEKVVFCLYGRSAFNVFKETLQELGA